MVYRYDSTICCNMFDFDSFKRSKNYLNMSHRSFLGASPGEKLILDECLRFSERNHQLLVFICRLIRFCS